MDADKGASVGEEWIKKKLNITHENLDDIKAISLPGSYQEKLTHLGNSLIKFNRLKELDLSRNALHSLEGLDHLKLLEKLNLYYNNIASIKELERLKHNTNLVELDLRLNPVTKEENDYRLHMIKLLPSLRILDDRVIRDSEREMAHTFLVSSASTRQHNGNGETNGVSNGIGTATNLEAENNAILSRVKSVSNIAKRSAGVNEEINKSDINAYRNIINLRSTAYQNGIDYLKGSNERLNSLAPRVEQYSPRGLKEVLNLESQSYNNFNNTQHHHQNGHNSHEAGNFQEINSNLKDSSKLKSYSMLNLRAINSGNENNAKQPNQQSSIPIKSKSVHFNEIASYLVDDSNHSSSEQTEEEEIVTPNKPMLINKALKDSEPEKADTVEDPKKPSIFELLDLVDRYWNGSKSLHKNQKFLVSANQIICDIPQKPPQPTLASNLNVEQISSMQTQIKLLQDENRQLKNEITTQKSKNESNLTSNKNSLVEIDSLSKKNQALQEENNNLRKELNEAKQKAAATNGSVRDYYGLEMIQSQNEALKHDIEIMKIKLKQFEHMQQLTFMLQESHKSLVSTNEHLLEEISKQKFFNSNHTKYNSNDCPHHGSSSISTDSISQPVYNNVGDSQQFTQPRVLSNRSQPNSNLNRFNTNYSNK